MQILAQTRCKNHVEDTSHMKSNTLATAWCLLWVPQDASVLKKIHCFWMIVWWQWTVMWLWIGKRTQGMRSYKIQGALYPSSQAKGLFIQAVFKRQIYFDYLSGGKWHYSTEHAGQCHPPHLMPSDRSANHLVSYLLRMKWYGARLKFSQLFSSQYTM